MPNISSGSIFEALRKGSAVEPKAKNESTEKEDPKCELKACPICGIEAPAGAEFCPACGGPLADKLEGEDPVGDEEIFEDEEEETPEEDIDIEVEVPEGDPEGDPEDPPAEDPPAEGDPAEGDPEDEPDEDSEEKFENCCGHEVTHGMCFCPVCGKAVEEPNLNPLEVGKYNDDTVEIVGKLLERAKAPAVIMKAYESKLYERCTTWLERAKGIKIDLREGFSKSETEKIKAHLESKKAPKMIMEAFEHGQYSVVSAYLKSRSK